MPKAARFTSSLVPSATSSQKTGEHPLDPRILFTGIGLLALIVAFVFGQPGVWL
jgi:hypothetical protein